MEKLLSKISVICRDITPQHCRVHLHLLTHPDHPSVKAITDTLDYFGVENLAANVPKDALEQLPKTFLALIKEDNGDELVLVQQKERRIKLTHISEKKKPLQKKFF